MLLCPSLKHKVEIWEKSGATGTRFRPLTWSERLCKSSAFRGAGKAELFFVLGGLSFPSPLYNTCTPLLSAEES